MNRAERRRAEREREPVTAEEAADEAGVAGLSMFLGALVERLSGATRCDKCEEPFVDRLTRKLCARFADGADGTGWAQISFLCPTCEMDERVRQPADRFTDFDRVLVN